MNIGRKVETTLELLERLTRQARERQDALDSDLDSEASSEIGQEVEEEKAKEEKVERNDKAEGKKRKLDSEIKVCERYNEEDANITLISSDSVAFKVHSFILLRASSVFKNMVGIAQTGSQRGPLELTDEFVEHSQVVEATLDILYNSEITSFKDDKLYHHVIEFARKYDMSTILKTISSQLRAHATSSDKGNTLRLLRVAIDLGECDLITSIVRATCGHVWPKSSATSKSGRPWLDEMALEELDYYSPVYHKKRPDPPPKDPEVESIFPPKTLSFPSPNLSTKTKEYISGGRAYELGSWPYEEFAALPTPLAWALLRADQTAVNMEFRMERNEAFGKELQKLLDSMYPKVVDLSASGNGASACRG